MKVLQFTIFGAEQKCASCVHLPSAKETYEWLEAAIKRKYPQQSFNFKYIDIHDENIDKHYKSFVHAIQNDEYFYPLVLLNDEVVAEATPRLKDIFAKIEQM